MAEEKMVAFCGIVCNECPAFIATQSDDDELREKTALKWSSDEYPLKSEDINCFGCVEEGKKMMDFCLECRVRKCGFEKSVKNCAYCDEYPCGKLKELREHLKLPEAKSRLDEIRKTLNENRGEYKQGN